MSDTTEPNQAEAALEEAEQICARRLCEILGLKFSVDFFISTNGGRVDCAVFDIGTPWTGDVMAFPATKFHWRGVVDLYSRDRRMIQKWIMRTILAMPIAPTQSQTDDLRGDTNVSVFRIPPEPNSIAEITTVELRSGANEKGIDVFTSSIKFDIIFDVGKRTR